MLCILSSVGDIILSLGLKYSEIMTLELIFRNKFIFMNACFYQKIILLTF